MPLSLWTRVKHEDLVLQSVRHLARVWERAGKSLFGFFEPCNQAIGHLPFPDHPEHDITDLFQILGCELLCRCFVAADFKPMFEQ